MSAEIRWRDLAKRLYWDLADRHERRAYVYALIWQIPGLFGDRLRAKYLAPRMKRAGRNLHVMAGCRFRSLENLEVGDNVEIGYDNFLQARGGLSIGSNVSTAPGVKIWSVNHGYDDPDMRVAEQEQVNRAVVIGDNVFIGSNAFVLPGTRLPDGCIVSAGAVVGAKPYKPYSILAGNPARVIGFRGGAPGTPGNDQSPQDPPQ